MKKIFTLLLALMIVFAVVSCDTGDELDRSDTDNPGTSQSGENNKGGDNNNGSQGSENNSSDAGEIDFGSVLSGNGATDVIYGQMDEAAKQRLIAEGKEAGYDVSFGADGSMTVVDADGTNVVQKPDGTWVIKDADGGEGQLGGNWPDNEYTRLVPRPDFELYAAGTDEESFFVSFSNVTVEEIKIYAAKVKAAGFNINEEVEDQEIGGIVVYSFIAENADGYTVEITSAAGVNAMTISK